MQKDSFKILTCLFERLSISFKSDATPVKYSWLLTLKDQPNVSLEYMNFSDNLINNFENYNNKDYENILKKELDLVHLLLPGNVFINGIFLIDSSDQNKIMKNMEQLIEKLFVEENKNEYINTSKPFFLMKVNSDFTMFLCKIYVKNEGFTEIPITFLKDDELKDILKDYFFLFSMMSFEYENIIKEEFLNNASFMKFKDSEIIVPVEKNYKYFELKNKSTNINNYEIVKDKWKAMLKQIKADTKKKFEENFKLGQLPTIVGKEIQLFFLQKNGDIPIIEVLKPEKQKSIIYLQIVSFCKTETDLKETLEDHLSEIKKEISLINKYLNSLNKKSNIGLYEFQNYISLFPRKCIFSLNENDEISINEKKTYYKLYDFPISRELLRKSDNLLQTLNFAPNKFEKIKNVHLALNTKRLDGGKIYMLYGNYVYHHYCQDNFDDKGWGCAYRSLQSVLSWFIEQSYSKEFPMPTHKEIQQMLVSMGDKPKEFLGSSEWIGAFEVNLILAKLLNIECKILHLSNGSDILSKVNEFKQHFIDQGTPIMFGGGVLAFTLLGIDHNEKTGETNFLILDPHYTGSDNIKNIIEKGGISWKKPDMFLSNTFYNFCLPQKPNLI